MSLRLMALFALAPPLAKYGFWAGVFALPGAIRLMDVEKHKKRSRR
jgi:hypothetical protein